MLGLRILLTTFLLMVGLVSSWNFTTFSDDNCGNPIQTCKNVASDKNIYLCQIPGGWYQDGAGCVKFNDLNLNPSEPNTIKIHGLGNGCKFWVYEDSSCDESKKNTYYTEHSNGNDCHYVPIYRESAPKEEQWNATAFWASCDK